MLAIWRRFALGLAMVGAMTLAAGPAAAQLAPSEPGGRSSSNFYDQGVPGNPATEPGSGVTVDFSGRLRGQAGGAFAQQGDNCHYHDQGVEGVPFHTDVQCHDHPEGTPGVVPAR